MALIDEVANYFGVTLAEAQIAIDAVDVAGIYIDLHSKITFSIWDKISPINGKPASMFLDKLVNSGEAYIIKDTDKGMVIFQPHAPNNSGFIEMGTANVGNHAQAHIDGIVTERATGRIIAEIQTNNPTWTPAN